MTMPRIKQGEARLLKTRDKMELDIDRMSEDAMRALLKAALYNQAEAVTSVTYEQIAERLNHHESGTRSTQSDV
jgi:hypothetical protein